ncbi:MAG: adaptor protein MecA [Clostridia bacterium]|nr:adaptor protein MecA [Clostridia bacterium]
MKIEKLTDNKIRIILNTDELLKQNIDVKTLVNNTDIAQNLFKDILKQAEKEVGFIVADSKLLIEAFVSSEGFFIVTFTKFKSEIKKNDIKVSKLKVKRKEHFSSSKHVVFLFNTFDEFCNFCTYIKNTFLDNLNKIAQRIVLYEYNSKFYLSLNNIYTENKNISLFYTSISEFAKIASSSIGFESKLIEHGKIIFKHNAIKNGIKYFV